MCYFSSGFGKKIHQNGAFDMVWRMHVLKQRVNGVTFSVTYRNVCERLFLLREIQTARRQQRQYGLWLNELPKRHTMAYESYLPFRQ